MKRFIVITISICFLISMFASCASNDAKESNNSKTAVSESVTSNSDQVNSPTEKPKPSETSKASSDALSDASSDEGSGEGVPVKTGMGVISTTTNNSKSAGAQSGVAQTETTVAAVLVDDNGVIVDCMIDMAYANIKFTSQGVIDTESSETCSSKADLGTAYGMGANSPIGKEWNEQAAAFADYVVGKTLEEVNGIEIGSNGKATDVDLVSSVTFRITDIHRAVIEAVNNAQHIGASSLDKLGMGIYTSIGSGTKNADTENGIAQANYGLATVTFGTDNKATSSILDEVKANVEFTKEGKITTQLGIELQSKLEAADSYGMKSSSSIGKEWYEQSKALSDYMIGKTIDEISGISIDDHVSETETDLIGSVTIQIGDCMQAITKASSAVK